MPMTAIPGVTAVGLVDRPAAGTGFSTNAVFKDSVTDTKLSNAAAEPYQFRASPGYFHAAGTALLMGRNFTWHDDGKAPHVAVVNAEFARKVFGSVTGAMGGYYKSVEGTRIQVVGIVEDGRYGTLTEDRQPAMFLPFLQSAIQLDHTGGAVEEQSAATGDGAPGELRKLDPGLPFTINTWTKELDSALFASRVATISLGVLGVLGAMWR